MNNLSDKCFFLSNDDYLLLNFSTLFLLSEDGNIYLLKKVLNKHRLINVGKKYSSFSFGLGGYLTNTKMAKILVLACLQVLVVH
jgi:hypothetical protein